MTTLYNDIYIREFREEMDPKKVQIWVDTLRSGDYSQTDGALMVRRPDRGDEYCCLGVCSEIAGVTKSIVFSNDLSVGDEVDDNGIRVGVFGTEEYYLPLEAQAWLRSVSPHSDFKTNNQIWVYDTEEAVGAYPAEIRVVSVASLNDRGRDFGYIADRLEETYLMEVQNG